MAKVKKRGVMVVKPQDLHSGYNEWITVDKKKNTDWKGLLDLATTVNGVEIKHKGSTVYVRFPKRDLSLTTGVKHRSLIKGAKRTAKKENEGHYCAILLK